MRIIELDASKWRDVLEFDAALKQALGSCNGHGNGPNAWIDSMIYGGMNKVEPPYVVRITGTSACSAELKREIELLARIIDEERGDVDVGFQIEP